MNEASAGFTLGAFLRARREQLHPSDVDLPSLGRRRTPGLRREEVAQLAHIGISWYTALEQGRQTNPSVQVLDSLARALKLNEYERQYMHRLVKAQDSAGTNEAPLLPAGLERTVRSLDPNPALVIDRKWDLLVWNRAAELVFDLPVFTDHTARPNWLIRFLTESTRRMNEAEQDEKVQVMIARFRADCARYPGDPDVQALIQELLETSEPFRFYWGRQDISQASDCYKRWEVAGIGLLEFEYINLQPSGSPDLQLMVYTASPAAYERLGEMVRGISK